MVGSVRPSSTEGGELPGTLVSEGETARGDGDGPWVQPAVEKKLIVSPHMTIDPQVLRNMVKQTAPAKSENTPNLSGKNKKISPRTLNRGTKSDGRTLSEGKGPDSSGTNKNKSVIAASSNAKSVMMEPKMETIPSHSGTIKKKIGSPISVDRTVPTKVINENDDLKNDARSTRTSGSVSKNSERNTIADTTRAANAKEKEENQKMKIKNQNRKAISATGIKSKDTDQGKDMNPKQDVSGADPTFEATIRKKNTIPNTSATNGVVAKVDLRGVATDLGKRPVTPPASNNRKAAGADVTDNASHNQRRPADLQVNLNICEEIAAASAPSIRDPSENYFSSDYTYPPGVQRDTAALGRDLYLRFLHEEMRTVHVREPPCMDPWRAARLDVDYSQSLNSSVRIRKSLRQVADAFACSEHRARVREQAAQVNIESLDYKSFQEMLYTLFQEGGMTSERVIVLFYFCADLTIRALNEHMTNCFHQLIEWSQLYIVDTLSMWVQQNGGWSAVLDQSANFVYTAAKFSLICASVVALCIFIRRAR